MLFNSLPFVYFLLSVWFVYLWLGRRAQNALLLAASYWFYAAWDPRFLGLILISTLVDYGCALGMQRSQQARTRTLLLLTSLGVNLGILGFFKYAGFFATEMARLLASVGWEVEPARLNWILPVGISFYTFQTLSYTIDVYRGKITPTRNLLNFALFVAFFPQLVAGPIERARRLLPQMEKPRRLDQPMMIEGLWLILLGFFKKTVVADNLFPIVSGMATGIPGMTGGELYIGLFACICYIYADFSGYSDLARGMARLLGFRLVHNFRMPFFAKNPAEFWRRWHISLSDWFRDYVFAPWTRVLLGRAPRGVVMGSGVMLALTLCGLWHGAAWNFVAFGAYHGAVMIGFFVLRDPWHRGREYLEQRTHPSVLWLSDAGNRLLHFHLIAFSAVMFFVPRLGDWGIWFQRVPQNFFAIEARDDLLTMLAFAGPLVLLDAWQYRHDDVLLILKKPRWMLVTVSLILFALIILAGVTETHEFVYFQF